MKPPIAIEALMVDFMLFSMLSIFVSICARDSAQRGSGT